MPLLTLATRVFPVVLGLVAVLDTWLLAYVWLHLPVHSIVDVLTWAYRYIQVGLR